MQLDYHFTSWELNIRATIELSLELGSPLLLATTTYETTLLLATRVGT